jgi:hypothetical protein
VTISDVYRKIRPKGFKSVVPDDDGLSETVKMARRYYPGGLLNENTVKTIAGKLLMNPAIQHMVNG